MEELKNIAEGMRHSFNKLLSYMEQQEQRIAKLEELFVNSGEEKPISTSAVSVSAPSSEEKGETVKHNFIIVNEKEEEEDYSTLHTKKDKSESEFNKLWRGGRTGERKKEIKTDIYTLKNLREEFEVFTEYYSSASLAEIKKEFEEIGGVEVPKGLTPKALRAGLIVAETFSGGIQKINWDYPESKQFIHDMLNRYGGRGWEERYKGNLRETVFQLMFDYQTKEHGKKLNWFKGEESNFREAFRSLRKANGMALEKYSDEGAETKKKTRLAVNRHSPEKEELYLKDYVEKEGDFSLEEDYNNPLLLEEPIIVGEEEETKTITVRIKKRLLKKFRRGMPLKVKKE